MREKEIKVSIIVPIYNVERYVDRCIESVIKQTYRNIEILLIDDGSKDASAIKIDTWKKKDKRIIVIHQANGGLSNARNTGIKAATGDYLMFVDSDDWIHKDMVNALVKGLEKADIVCCGMIKAMDDKQTDLAWYSEEKILTNIEAIKKLVENDIFTSHIQKNIFPKYVFDTIMFPEGKLFEDIRIAHKLYLQVGKICILPKRYYYYYVRNDSITNAVKLGNQIEWFDALEERAQDLLTMLTTDELDRIKSQKAVVMSLAVVQNNFSSIEKQHYKNKMYEIKNFLNEKSTQEAVKRYATRTQYIYYYLARIFFYSANRLYRMMRMKK